MEVLCFLPSIHYPLYDFDLRATHGFVLVRVRVHEKRRSGSEDDNASGAGYDPPDGFRDLDLGFLVPLPSGFNPGEFWLAGSIGNRFTPPLRGSQGRRGSFLLRGA
jgi:hypothetical protein